MSDRQYCYCPVCLYSCMCSEDNQCHQCKKEMIIIEGAKNIDDRLAFVKDPERKKDPRFSQETYEKRKQPNTYRYPNSGMFGVKCISCGSSNVKKISVASKVGSVALWGVFAAGRTSKRYHCNQCGTEW